MYCLLCRVKRWHRVWKHHVTSNLFHIQLFSACQKANVWIFIVVINLFVSQDIVLIETVQCNHSGHASKSSRWVQHWWVIFQLSLLYAPSTQTGLNKHWLYFSCLFSDDCPQTRGCNSSLNAVFFSKSLSALVCHHTVTSLWGQCKKRGFQQRQHFIICLKM